MSTDTALPLRPPGVLSGSLTAEAFDAVDRGNDVARQALQEFEALDDAIAETGRAIAVSTAGMTVETTRGGAKLHGRLLELLKAENSELPKRKTQVLEEYERRRRAAQRCANLAHGLRAAEAASRGGRAVSASPELRP